jgi:Holliday junction resolvasome RuvABC ATP-dependent DNA helicase subunit
LIIFWRIIVGQHQRVFFDIEAPSDDERRNMVDSNNPDSPFYKFIGNSQAIRKLQVAAYTALGRRNHRMNELSFAIFGPSSAGKTTLARIYAETVELPFLELSPKSLVRVEDLFKEASKLMASEDLPLVEMGPGYYECPPMIIFIDEVHALSNTVVQGLLKATEPKDCKLVTETGKTIDTTNVTWMIATTDEGRLFDAFRTRFSTVMLRYLTKEDIARVVKLNNPDLDDSVCSLVASYNSRVPRKALEFARYLRMSYVMDVGMTWESVARMIAKNEGIDEFGMHESHLKILRALGNGPVARNRMTVISGRKEEENERYILPWLMEETDDQPSLITVTSKGYTITHSGIKELYKRGIVHNGEKAIAA